MRTSLLAVLLDWWRSGRSYDATGTGLLLRSDKVRSAAEDLPKVNRCPKCPAFVQKAGHFCFRCDPSVLTRERLEREARTGKRPAGAVAPFRRPA